MNVKRRLACFGLVCLPQLLKHLFNLCFQLDLCQSTTKAPLGEGDRKREHWPLLDPSSIQPILFEFPYIYAKLLYKRWCQSKPSQMKNRFLCCGSVTGNFHTLPYMCFDLDHNFFKNTNLSNLKSWPRKNKTMTNLFSLTIHANLNMAKIIKLL